MALATRLYHDNVNAMVLGLAEHADSVALSWPEGTWPEGLPSSWNDLSALYCSSLDALGAGLDVVGTDLLSALEAVAVRDVDGSRLEHQVDEMLAAIRQGVPTLTVPVTSRHDENARYGSLRVRRLDGGGVLVSTPPPELLGPLFQEALTLLR